MAEVEDALRAVVAQLPGGGEARPGQERMAVAVAAAFDGGHHLVVQAGTGTGKTLAYLVPAILARRRTIVATATKALQDQLATKDLPFLVEHLTHAFSWAVLKGRSNYVCLQRVAEVAGGGTAPRPTQTVLLELDDEVGPAVKDEIRRIVGWSLTTETGDRAELPWEPSAAAWSQLSVGSDECPGAARCPVGGTCFAERARALAAQADVVVVNTHLYGLHVASKGGLLPEHDLVVVDEAHVLEEVISDTNGLELGQGRFAALARIVRGVIADDALVEGLRSAGSRLADALEPYNGQRLVAGPPEAVVEALALARGRLDSVAAALRNAGGDGNEKVSARKARAQRATGNLQVEVALGQAPPASHVAWVEGKPGDARLCLAPIDVAGTLDEGLWSQHTSVLTSATLPLTLAARYGLADDGYEALDVGSPFDYPNQAVLYCAAHLPDPRTPTYEAAMHDELEALIGAASGRTLALFTSWRAMKAAAAALEPRLPFTVYTQLDLPKPALVKRFRAEESSCLFATMGFWQGIDVPGASLTLVTIDRLPFARPDEPLLQARRERAGATAFRTIDLPRAAVLLAQAAGRLIRTADDRGVVAVLDPRLASANYRWDLVRAVPPMRRTRDRSTVEEFLRGL